MVDQAQVCNDVLENIKLLPFRIQGLELLKGDAMVQFDQQISALQQLKENTRAQFDQQIAALQQDLIQLEQMAEVLQCSAPLVPTPTPDAESVPSDCAQVAQRIADDEIMLGKLPANDPAIPALDTDMRRMRQKAQVLNCP